MSYFARKLELVSHILWIVVARSKLISIETLATKALIDHEISHKEYRTIINEEEHRKIKEDIKMMKSGKTDVK